MSTYSDLSDVINEDTKDQFGDFITYSIVDDQSALGSISYYGTASTEYTNFATSFVTTHASVVDDIITAIYQITASSTAITDPYAVTFASVANITFYNTDLDGNGDHVFDAGEEVGNIVIGLGTGSMGDFSTHPDATSLEYDSNNGRNGDIWINTDHDSSTWTDTNIWLDDAIFPGTPAYIALMHEVGHSLGLDHPHDINSSTLIDNQQYTIMSYNALPGMVDTSDITNTVSPYGLQLFDIAALQSLYGINWDTRSGDTVYSVNTAFTSSVVSGAFIYTIWDGGGVDIVDASEYSHHALIDLRQGAFSSIGDSALTTFNPGTVNGFTYDEGQAKDNVAIAFHAIVENAIGTDQDDTIIGNAWNNILYGAAGSDLLYGDGILHNGDAGYHEENTIPDATNTVYPWGPDDIAPGTDHSGDDVLIGGADDDHLFGGLGDDILHGGYVWDDIDGVRSGWDSASQFPSSSFDIDYEEDGNDTADYSKLNTAANISFAGAQMDIWYITYGNAAATVQKGLSTVGGLDANFGVDTLFSIEHVIGTSNNDVFIVNDTMSTTDPLVLSGGDGNDWYVAYMAGAGGLIQVDDSGGSSDTVALGENTSQLSSYFVTAHTTTIGLIDYFDLDISSSSTSSPYLTVRLDKEAILNGTGIDRLYIGSIFSAPVILSYFSSHTGTLNLEDVYHDVYLNGGTGGTGGGGGTILEYDGSGNVIGQRVESSIGGSAISSAIASVIDHPFVITSFSENFGGGGLYTSNVTMQTYEKAFEFIPDITIDEVRLTMSGTQGHAALTIHVDSESYALTVSDFETGRTINGISIYDQELHVAIQEASDATLTSSATNTYSGSYTSTNSLGVDSNGTVSVTYYLEQLNFFFGASIDLTAPITFTGSSSGETLTGLDNRADTIYGMAGNDTIYGYGGNDTIIGGAGADGLNGGLGNDTYVFASGWGSDTITESLSSGTDVIHFTGIDPSDIRMYTDVSNGKLHLTSISDPTNTIAVNAGITGSNTSESTVGLYVESVTFDDANNTVWDLTGALTLTGTSSADALYGTAYGDTIYGLAGNDTIYGNAGNDTITGGAGTDVLTGGPGNDTYVFASGWGSDTVVETTSGGTDTIHFTGIDPSDIRMYTDVSNGKLHLTSISDPTNTIAVNAGITGSNTSESTVGLYVESVTFDDANNTVWDLTGALTFTGTSSADALYGTAYGDTIYGLAGNDTIYGNAGNDTITGGAGTDVLTGGPGNDTYVFASGWGSDTVVETTSGGTDTIHFIGIDPSDIRIYTDVSNGKLHLTSISDPTNTIAVNAGITGSNTSESTAGLYVESVTFDDANNTVWDLTGALTFTGTSGADALYGTAYGDTIYGLAGNDTIYGNAGNDTITGGAGTDVLTGGPGNDTYVFASGWGSDTVVETTSGGTDTIHFIGIDPSDIRIYTDVSNGKLHLTSISDPTNTIAVNAGITGSNTSESTAGLYVESVTFDDANNTVWDLTGGLTITGSSSGESLYGTAYNDTIYGLAGNDTIYGNAGDDALNGGDGVDTLRGGPGSDVLCGDAGADNLYGEAGADTFLFKSATALSASDNIQDFSTGAGDKIDISDVISGYDPLNDAITDWVQITTSGSNSLLKVDIDGAANGTSWTQIATIIGVTGLTDEAALVSSGNLIVS